MDDLRKIIYGVLVLFVVVLLGFISFIYISGCGFTLTCPQGQPLVERTPIPTLIPATLPVPDHTVALVAFNKCQIAAVDLIGAWVSAHYPENDKFTFTDVKGAQCEGTFKKDVQPLFTESNIWYAGSPACDSCHQPDLTKAIKNMDLSSYAGIIAGSGRANGEAKGKDILGGGNWDQALIHQMLYAPNGQTLIGRPAMPFGRPADVPANGPLVYAGAAVAGAPAVVPTSAATSVPAADIARPSNPGGPGAAVDLTGNVEAGKKVFVANCEICHMANGAGGHLNPGSTDGTIPPLNPIDETLKSSDYKTYAYNLDLFIEHGSKPAGTQPLFQMPAWGDKGLLVPQQIADVIAYLISLNP
jgi:mono/diheme cytochrome c family protein